MYKIYHNPRCRKSRAGLEYLKSKTDDIIIRTYLKEELSLDELEEILLKFNKNPIEIVRTQEEYYRKNLKGKSFTNQEWKKILLENPKLIARPIIVSKFKAILGDPPKNIDKVL